MMIAAVGICFVALFLTVILLVRFCKRQLAAFHRAVTNRITIRFVGRLPGFGIVSSVGRKSGKLYRTPVNVFREPDRFLIALTYGPDSGWVKNVLAADGCELETRGLRYQLSSPIVIHDPSRRRFPPLVRVILRFIASYDFLQLQASPNALVS
jgi:deazaflavin-dependent oxidoreductase (nitroreductase family)